MKIEVKSDTSVYITINGYTYYIDDSTNEQIVEKFKTPPYKEMGHLLTLEQFMTPYGVLLIDKSHDDCNIKAILQDREGDPFVVSFLYDEGFEINCQDSAWINMGITELKILENLTMEAEKYYSAYYMSNS